MKVLVIGASGHIGSAAARALAENHEVVRASRTADIQVDISDPASVQRMFERVGTVDAVIACVGSVPFKPLSELTVDDFANGIGNKVLGQVNIVQQGIPYMSDGGSFTLTTGILAREAILTGAVASLTNGALESFVIAAAAELPRGLRINAVSPTVLEEATAYHSSFPGFTRIPAEEVALAYVRSVEGIQTGRIYALDGR